jgi:hypothetical protein
MELHIEHCTSSAPRPDVHSYKKMAGYPYDGICRSRARPRRNTKGLILTCLMSNNRRTLGLGVRSEARLWKTEKYCSILSRYVRFAK